MIGLPLASTSTLTTTLSVASSAYSRELTRTLGRARLEQYVLKFAYGNKDASAGIIGRPGTQWAPLFEELATNVAIAPPVRPKPQTQDQLLGLFSAESTGRDFKMEPATLFDMVGKTEVIKPTLEVIYDEV